MSAKDKKSEVFSYFKKAKGELLARSHAISSNKGVLSTSYICVNANVDTLERTHDRGTRLCVLRSLHGFPGKSC